MTRTVELPAAFNAEGVEATFEHGILTLHIPKAQEVQPKHIPVRTKEVAGV